MMDHKNLENLDYEEIYHWAHDGGSEEAFALLRALDRKRDDEIEERLFMERRQKELEARERDQERRRDGRDQ